MWVQDNGRRNASEIAIMIEARAMRDEALARMITTAWHGIVNFGARLLHAGEGHARSH